MTGGRRKSIISLSPIVFVSAVAVSLVNSSTINGPVDTAATVGETATMYCTSKLDGGDVSTIWQYHPVQKAEIIYDSRDNSSSRFPGFSVEPRVRGQYNLKILKVSLNHAVLYQCRTDYTYVMKEARFTALEKIICPGRVYNGTNTFVVCSVRFKGAIPPSLTWSNDGGIIIASQTSITDGVVKASMNVTIDSYQDVTFKCSLDFKPSSIAYTNKCYTYYRPNASVCTTGTSLMIVFAVITALDF